MLLNKDKKNIIINILNLLFPNPKINLFYTNKFTLIISVYLSINSRESIVNNVSKKLFNIADTPEKMITIPKKKIKKIIKPIGMYNIKTNYIYKISKYIIKLKNIIPKKEREIRKIPGIGIKCSAIISNVLYNKKTFPIDRHIYKLLTKWKISDKKYIYKMTKDAKNFFPKKYWNILHLQLILYSREYSPKIWGIFKIDIIYNVLKNLN